MTAMPSFGSHTSSTVVENTLFVLRAVFLKAPQLLVGLLMRFWTVVLGLLDVVGEISLGFVSSPPSAPLSAPSALYSSDVPPLGSDYVVGR